MDQQQINGLVNMVEKKENEIALLKRPLANKIPLTSPAIHFNKVDKGTSIVFKRFMRFIDQED